jgi:bacterioferritin
MLKHWGLARMAKHEHDESIERDEARRRSSSTACSRWTAMPNPQDLGKLAGRRHRGRGAEPATSRSETSGAQATVKEAIAHCRDGRATMCQPRALRSASWKTPKEHIDYLETQLDLVAKVGEQNYLQSQMHEA